MNLKDKQRITQDIIVYKNFISSDDCVKIIQVLDAQANSGAISWMPISFYESYSSVLPKDNDQEVIDAAQAAGVTMYFTDTRHFFH